MPWWRISAIPHRAEGGWRRLGEQLHLPVLGGYHPDQGAEAPDLETTALGAAYLAGLAVGFWDDQEETAACGGSDCTYEPQIGAMCALQLLEGWAKSGTERESWVASS